MVSIRLARRFLFSPKSHSIINLIAVVSVVAIAVPTAAMILILSLHNGINDQLGLLYRTVDAPISVRAQQGQYFEVDSTQLIELRKIGATSVTLQCNALLEWGGRQAIGVVRGVDTMFDQVTDISSTIIRGEWATKMGDRPRAVVGAGMSYQLSLSLGIGEPLHVMSILPTPTFMRALGVPLMGEGDVSAIGVFTLEAQTDLRYVFTDIAFVQKLLAISPHTYSSVEIAPSGDLGAAKQQIKEILNSEVTVEDRIEQRAMMYSVVQAEKYMVFLVLILVSIIASMSLSGCTLMMISDKRSATDTLRSMGMNGKQLQTIFVNLSMLIVLIGVASGLLLGLGLSLIQLYFKPLKMAGDTLLYDSYLVTIYPLDIVVTGASALMIGYLIVRLTVGRVKKWGSKI